MESKELADAFEKELKALLRKYNTEIEMEDTGYGYYADYTMRVYIPSKWDKEGVCVQPSAEIELGKYYDGNEN